MTLITLPPEAQSRRAELPSKNGTPSYWHRDPSKTLLKHRTTRDLPISADVIVIGSGISGAFAARQLVAGGRNVVMLEAREAIWGATGRNGGHCQPTVWSSTEEVARFELATFEMVKRLVEEHDIPCDWRVVGGVHPIYSQEALEAAEKKIKRLQKYPDLKNKAILIKNREELAARHVPEALGAIFQPNAAKLWPYKLVAWVLETLLSKHDAATFNLQTNTPATRLERRKSSWVVHTPRGEIQSRDVLLATNGYTSYLLPKLTNAIVPVRGQICALEPPHGSIQLPHSYVWTKDGSDQYLIHRGLDDTQVGAAASRRAASTGDRSLILGGKRYTVPEGEEGISRDDTINPLVSRALHRGLWDAIKLLPGGRPEQEVLRSTYEWTGIMGYSHDGHPYVGPVPGAFVVGAGADADGLWISAAYTGHGMPVAPRCGVAVADMILGKQDGVKVPAAWIPSEERIARTQAVDLSGSVEAVGYAVPVSAQARL